MLNEETRQPGKVVTTASCSDLKRKTSASHLRDITETYVLRISRLLNVTAAIMGWSAPDGVLSRLLSGDPLAILIAFVVSISLPLLLHLYLYRTSTRAVATPVFLLLGTTGAGKTSLFTLVSMRSFCGAYLGV
jgi:hypothetical protein